MAGGSAQDVTLPASNKLDAGLLVDYINTRIRGVTFEAKDSRIVMRTLDVGRQAAVFVLATSTFLAHAGIPTNREYRGRQIAPGWTIVNDPTTLPDRPARLIVFDEPLRGLGDYVEINYTTIREECRRCGGVGKENDWRYGLNGEVVQVVDEALLIQEITKIFYTRQGSNQFHTWYGTHILDAIGRKITPSGFLQNFIVSDLQQAFRRWQSIKKAQEENVGQEVTDREYPFALQDVKLKQSTQDPTVIFVKCTIQSRSADPIQLERGLRFPVPLSVTDPNNATGTIRGSLSDFILVEGV
jgi:phage baseplate assembly protein W